MSDFSIQTGSVEDFTTARDDGWYTVNFDPAFPEGTIPQVFAQIQTYNGKDTPGLRIKSVSNTSFDVRMNEVVMSNANSSVVGDLGTVDAKGAHPNAETLGWLALAIG